MSNISSYPQPSAPPYSAYYNPPYNPQSYSYGYEKPPAYEPPPAYQEPRTAPGREMNFEEDKCSICFNPLSEAADDDAKKNLEVAKTKCDHYFHNFCIQNFFTDCVNQNCPNCRTELHAREISVIKLGQKKAEDKPKIEQTAEQGSSLAGSALTGLGNAIAWSTNTVGYLGSAVLNAIFPPATREIAERHGVNTAARLNTAHKEMKAALDKQQERISILIGTLNSLTVQDADLADRAFTRVDGALDVMKLQFQRSQDELNAFLAREQTYLTST